MGQKKGQLIVALDVDTFEEAQKLIDVLIPSVDIFKVGSQLFTACGPVVIRYILSKGKEVFLDLKYHDIPNTVANAVKAATSLGKTVYDVLGDAGEKLPANEGVLMCTIHTLGGKEMLEYARRSVMETSQSIKVRRPLIIGITVLTSEKKEHNIQKLVLERALLAKEAGLDGIVASSQEASMLRKELGDDFIIVTPGIRPAGAEVGDQKRVTTPEEAIKNGSNYLVVGRPIVKASDPLEAAKNILKEIKRASD